MAGGVGDWTWGRRGAQGKDSGIWAATGGLGWHQPTPVEGECVVAVGQGAGKEGTEAAGPTASKSIMPARRPRPAQGRGLPDGPKPRSSSMTAAVTLAQRWGPDAGVFGGICQEEEQSPPPPWHRRMG